MKKKQNFWKTIYQKIKIKRILKIFLGILLFLFLICLFSFFEVNNKTSELHSSRITQIEKSKVAVVLGTSAYISRGKTNPYFKYRINAAARLYKNGKVDYILVSGDNRRNDYNEPLQMRKALEARGIPSDRIVLDYAGFRTLDSMIRAREVFGLEEFIVVSQRFHNQRALYIASYYGINARAYNARDIEHQNFLGVPLREVFARVKMMLDLYILKTEPKFLGEKIFIGEDASSE